MPGLLGHAQMQGLLARTIHFISGVAYRAKTGDSKLTMSQNQERSV